MNGDAADGRARRRAGRATRATCLGLALAAGACSQPPDPAGDDEATSPLAVVQGQIDAFNRQNAEDMLAWVAPAVEWINVQGGTTSVEVRSREALRDYMATYFEALPTARSTIEDAVVTGEFVAVRERASWTSADGEERSQASLAVYQVRDGLIQRVWYYPIVP